MIDYFPTRFKCPSGSAHLHCIAPVHCMNEERLSTYLSVVIVQSRSHVSLTKNKLFEREWSLTESVR